MATMASIAEQIPGLSELHEQSLGDPRICVAILDGEVDRDHPSLVSAHLQQVEQRESAVSPSEHGTLIASVLFGQPTSHVRGLVPQCTGVSIPIFRNSPGGGVRPASQMDLAHAINWALDLGADVINISGGQITSSSRAYPLLEDIIARCHQKGTLIVAAAGNDGCDCIHVPAAIENVLAVGASDQEGRSLESSNWGESYRHNGILALGENILGADLDGDTRFASGTSLAAAVVSGVVGLLMSLQRQHGRQPNAVEIGRILLATADHCDDESTSCGRWPHGRLNLPKAIDKLRSTREATMSHIEPNQSVPQESEQPCTVTPSAMPTPGSMPTEYASVAPPLAEAPMPAEPPAEIAAGEITPSACSCSCGSGQKVFVLGQLGFDYGSEARRDEFRSRMGPDRNVDADSEIVAHLKEHLWDAASIIWTLKFDQTVVYTLRPSGPFAREVYEKLRDELSDQESGKTAIISVPGTIVGEDRLLSIVRKISVGSLRGFD